LGVLLEAKTHGYIPSMQSVVEQIWASDFRISPELLNEILIKSGEPPFV
jgi:predicted nucleic acid-binding protein